MPVLQRFRSVLLAEFVYILLLLPLPWLLSWQQMHHLPQIWGLAIAALEEGVEMSLPLLFIIALAQYRHMRAQDVA